MAEPRQGSTNRAPFRFNYVGNDYEVSPLASYEIAGLVVSHNEITHALDAVHDESSIDTKDLCVLWGSNLKQADYRAASYESSAFRCFVSWDRPIAFDQAAIANNHLITNSQVLRDALSRVRIGDQVRIKGMLVAYRDLRAPDYWRTSSMTRTDRGDGACEVLFFEGLEVLARHQPVAYTLRDTLPWIMLWVVAALVGLKVVPPHLREAILPPGAGRRLSRESVLTSRSGAQKGRLG